jgi:surface carbohydrate biosynthesis protein (TIGR04326 family)
MEKHFMLESYVSIKIIFQIIKDYLKIQKIGIFASKLKEIKPRGSSLELWEMHSEDFYKSIRGKDAVKNCIFIALFENFMKNIPKQRLGIYMSENQPWELALIHAWRSAGHGILVGAPHNTLRYWDLRHHFDVRTYDDANLNKYPMPNLLAINGPVAMKNIISSGYPKNQLVRVEALRYNYLLRDNIQYRDINTFNILICADYQEKNTIQILDWMLSIKESLPKNTKITFRSHPIYKVDVTKFGKLNLITSKDELLDDLSSADVVIAGLISSAAADAYARGLPVIQIFDGSVLNMSPLRSIKGVHLVSSRLEMLNVLSISNISPTMSEEYFYLSHNLVYWSKILCD